jgi:tetratricopeptide (TPR) repeat protein
MDGFKLAKIFRGFSPEGTDTKQFIEQSLPSEVITHLESYMKENPNQWLIRYTIGDWYTRDNRYIDALNALDKAYEIRPRDPRSTYALATTYRILARARLVGFDVSFDDVDMEDMQKFANETHGSVREILESQSEFDPKASADELEKLELTIDEVATKALEYFEETLRLGVRTEELKFVINDLQIMYSQFPHLELKVKNKRNVNTGIMGMARKGSGGVLNEAIEKYSRLRILVDQPGRYRYELAETIRLCQWAIASDKKLGDPYVLLANCYSLLDSQLTSSVDPNIYKKWAIIVLHQWMNTPLKNYPFTKKQNTEIGQQLYTSLISQLSQIYGITNQDMIDRINLDSLAEILSPAVYERIKDQLVNEPII